MPRRGEIPEWAAKERESDLAWIGENLHVFLPAAQQGFTVAGRGAIVTDTAILVVQEGGRQSHPFGYIPLPEIEQRQWQDVIRMVKTYEPNWEFVAVLLKGNRESAYRVGVPSARK